ncbi:MAG: hypothetical protein AAF235_11420, partial [Planctomycetota bacterium]
RALNPVENHDLVTRSYAVVHTVLRRSDSQLIAAQMRSAGDDILPNDVSLSTRFRISLDT